MRNNKGFSLVELIIVIAIMAILIGVMAPQLIKYIEKTNVSSDTQLCDTVKSAITTAMLDPSVITASDYTMPTSGNITAIGGGATFQAALEETLGCAPSALAGKLKSKSTAGGKVNSIEVIIANGNSVHVYIPNSSADGKGGSDPIYVD